MHFSGARLLCVGLLFDRCGHFALLLAHRGLQLFLRLEFAITCMRVLSHAPILNGLGWIGIRVYAHANAHRPDADLKNLI